MFLVFLNAVELRQYIFGLSKCSRVKPVLFLVFLNAVELNQYVFGLS